VKLKPEKFNLQKDDRLFLVFEVMRASYQPMVDSESRVTLVERDKARRLPTEAAANAKQ